MECAVITTYRCNGRCQMCHVWQNPTRKSEEFPPEILEKLPGGMNRINITGGEPMLRDDILDIVRVLDKKTRQVEISTNGYFTDRIVRVCEEFPHTAIRVSVEGLPELNDELRGINDGFDHALRTLLHLKQMGIRNIGFGIVISDRNCADLLDLYTLCTSMGVEFGSAAMHNSFYFHKHDNRVEELERVTQQMERFVHALLTSRRSDWRLRVKDWARAYVNRGLLRHMLGKTRPLSCGAGTDTFFVSPFGEILACNGSEEPWLMGDLRTQTFREIWYSRQAQRIREKVACCDRNCWMVGTVRPAMRRHVRKVLAWILTNRLRLLLGKDIVME